MNKRRVFFGVTLFCLVQLHLVHSAEWHSQKVNLAADDLIELLTVEDMKGWKTYIDHNPKALIPFDQFNIQDAQELKRYIKHNKFKKSLDTRLQSPTFTAQDLENLAMYGQVSVVPTVPLVSTPSASDWRQQALDTFTKQVKTNAKKELKKELDSAKKQIEKDAKEFIKNKRQGSSTKNNTGTTDAGKK